MEPFIITLTLSIICNFFAMRRYKEFKGASKKLHNYLMFSSGIGTTLVYITVVVSCFFATWWIPLVAFVVARVIGTIIPLNIWGEIIGAMLWPIFLTATIILMIL